MSQSKKKEVIAYARFLEPGERVRVGRAAVEGDMRLVASPLRYYVEIFKQELSWHRAQGRHPPAMRKFMRLTWNKMQAMKRTRNTYDDWEFFCAGRMFERRVKERQGVLTFQLWPSEDGRLTRLCDLHDQHLKNIFFKIALHKWRKPWLPHIMKEMDRRGLNYRGGTNGKTQV
jgi:hypothetical protein